MKNYAYTFAAALLVGLAAGFYLWHQREISPDRTVGILVGTPKGRLEVLKTSRVRAREGHLLVFVVVNASDTPRTVSLGFFRGKTPVNVCEAGVLPIAIGSHRFETVTCKVRRGLVDSFPQDPGDEDEKDHPNVRAFDYKISFDGETYYDPRLVIER